MRAERCNTKKGEKRKNCTVYTSFQLFNCRNLDVAEYDEEGGEVLNPDK